ncbi:MAG: alpha/beta hydrolase [Candidatus Alcyoniella australis]|nr:alpha/beta hydrolase [Candidatus Alcyoniella australis]
MFNRNRLLVLILLATLCLALSAQAADLREARDISYFQGDQQDWEYHLLDVFSPLGPGPYPVLIFVHGGAWRIGDKDNPPHTALARNFAQLGFVCVSINYRLTPRVAFPEHARDVAQAVAWTVNNVASYGGDPQKIVISGHSAGAHLATIVALDPQYLAQVGLTPQVFSGAIGFSGPYDIANSISNAKSGNMTRRKLEGVFGDDPAMWDEYSPIHHASPHFPPTLIVVGERDRLTTEEVSRRFCDALNAKREDPTPPAELAIVPRKGHIGLLFKLGYENDSTAERVKAFIHRVTGTAK